MKVVILAGGFGTRISEESHLRPKPMIEIGGKPIVWHLMKYFSFFGFNDFVICAGYKQEVIKEWFANYSLHNSDVTFSFGREGKTTIHSDVSEPWNVTIVDTGLNTMTGGRIKHIAPFVGKEPFFMTYGDGLADVDLRALLKKHHDGKCLATITAVQPDERFGIVDFGANDTVKSFREKDKNDAGWINGGFMVLEPSILPIIGGDASSFEKDTLSLLAAKGQVDAYRHHGFWQCMDTMRDKDKLEALWSSGKAPWLVWKD